MRGAYLSLRLTPIPWHRSSEMSLVTNPIPRSQSSGPHTPLFFPTLIYHINCAWCGRLGICPFLFHPCIYRPFELGADLDAYSYPFDRIKRLFDINVHGAFFTAREAARNMIPQGGGSIVLVASMSANVSFLPTFPRIWPHCFNSLYIDYQHSSTSNTIQRLQSWWVPVPFPNLLFYFISAMWIAFGSCAFWLCSTLRSHGYPSRNTAVATSWYRRHWPNHENSLLWTLRTGSGPEWMRLLFLFSFYLGWGTRIQRRLWCRLHLGCVRDDWLLRNCYQLWKGFTSRSFPYLVFYHLLLRVVFSRVFGYRCAPPFWDSHSLIRLHSFCWLDVLFFSLFLSLSPSLLSLFVVFHSSFLIMTFLRPVWDIEHRSKFYFFFFAFPSRLSIPDRTYRTLEVIVNPFLSLNPSGFPPSPSIISFISRSLFFFNIPFSDFGLLFFCYRWESGWLVWMIWLIFCFVFVSCETYGFVFGCWVGEEGC